MKQNFQVSTDHDFVSLLTLFQNSSNPVHNRDLRSNDPVQIRLKHELRRRGYYYENKTGEDMKKWRQHTLRFGASLMEML